jgi:hypothetical protein
MRGRSPFALPCQHNVRQRTKQVRALQLPWPSGPLTLRKGKPAVACQRAAKASRHTRCRLRLIIRHTPATPHPCAPPPTCVAHPEAAPHDDHIHHAQGLRVQRQQHGGVGQRASAHEPAGRGRGPAARQRAWDGMGHADHRRSAGWGGWRGSPGWANDREGEGCPPRPHTCERRRACPSVPACACASACACACVAHPPG